MNKSGEVEKVIKSVKNFGFEIKLLKNQNKNFKTEKDKRAHLNNVDKNIMTVRADLYLVLRYLELVKRKIRNIKGGRVIVLRKEDLVKEIEKYKNNYLYKWELESITERLIKKSELEIRELYNDIYIKLTKKFESKKDRLLILESLYEKRERNFNPETKIKEYDAELLEKSEDLRLLQVWIRKEIEKYENIKLFIKNDKDEKKGKDENNLIVGKNTVKEKWAGTKSEFADKVKEEYENNPQKYKSLSDASNKMFEKYGFEDKKWTKAKCYDLVRK